MANQSGFIKFIILIIILLIVLSYFGINIRSLFESDLFKNNFNYVWGGVKYVWETYLLGPVKYLWNNIFIDLLWNSFIENMDRIRQGKSPEMIENAPEAVPSQ
ncbi:MAG: hypothetical protein HY773_02145 [Candidatus Terrybacteria bacterium]|nr:hypothetical protein [Candidatus Terrybacteria bacterium]